MVHGDAGIGAKLQQEIDDDSGTFELTATKNAKDELQEPDLSDIGIRSSVQIGEALKQMAEID